MNTVFTMKLLGEIDCETLKKYPPNRWQIEHLMNIFHDLGTKIKSENYSPNICVSWLTASIQNQRGTNLDAFQEVLLVPPAETEYIPRRHKREGTCIEMTSNSAVENAEETPRNSPFSRICRSRRRKSRSTDCSQDVSSEGREQGRFCCGLKRRKQAPVETVVAGNLPDTETTSPNAIITLSTKIESCNPGGKGKLVEEYVHKLPSHGSCKSPYRASESSGICVPQVLQVVREDNDPLNIKILINSAVSCRGCSNQTGNLEQEVCCASPTSKIMSQSLPPETSPSAVIPAAEIESLNSDGTMGNFPSYAEEDNEIKSKSPGIKLEAIRASIQPYNTTEQYRTHRSQHDDENVTLRSFKQEGHSPKLVRQHTQRPLPHKSSARAPERIGCGTTPKNMTTSCTKNTMKNSALVNEGVDLICTSPYFDDVRSIRSSSNNPKPRRKQRAVVTRSTRTPGAQIALQLSDGRDLIHNIGLEQFQVGSVSPPLQREQTKSQSSQTSASTVGKNVEIRYMKRANPDSISVQSIPISNHMKDSGFNADVTVTVQTGENKTRRCNTPNKNKHKRHDDMSVKTNSHSTSHETNCGRKVNQRSVKQHSCEIRRWDQSDTDDLRSNGSTSSRRNLKKPIAGKFHRTEDYLQVHYADDGRCSINSRSSKSSAKRSKRDVSSRDRSTYSSLQYLNKRTNTDDLHPCVAVATRQNMKKPISEQFNRTENYLQVHYADDGRSSINSRSSKSSAKRSNRDVSSRDRATYSSLQYLNKRTNTDDLHPCVAVATHQNMKKPISEQFNRTENYLQVHHKDAEKSSINSISTKSDDKRIRSDITDCTTFSGTQHVSKRPHKAITTDNQSTWFIAQQHVIDRPESRANPSHWEISVSSTSRMPYTARAYSKHRSTLNQAPSQETLEVHIEPIERGVPRIHQHDGIRVVVKGDLVKQTINPVNNRGQNHEVEVVNFQEPEVYQFSHQKHTIPRNAGQQSRTASLNSCPLEVGSCHSTQTTICEAIAPKSAKDLQKQRNLCQEVELIFSNGTSPESIQSENDRNQVGTIICKAVSSTIPLNEEQRGLIHAEDNRLKSPPIRKQYHDVETLQLSLETRMDRYGKQTRASITHESFPNDDVNLDKEICDSELVPTVVSTAKSRCPCKRSTRPTDDYVRETVLCESSTIVTAPCLNKNFRRRCCRATTPIITPIIVNPLPTQASLLAGCSTICPLMGGQISGCSRCCGVPKPCPTSKISHKHTHEVRTRIDNRLARLSGPQSTERPRPKCKAASCPKRQKICRYSCETKVTCSRNL